jgi:parallel beta-helix repeat protein
MTRHLRPALIALVALLLLPASAAAATTLYVDGNVGNDASPCTSPGLGACRTIQAAIDKAPPGATISVAASTYPEPAPGPLTVNKPLTLLGAQSGVDARTRAGAESVVTDPQGTFVTASGVTIDGFTVQDSIVAAFTGYGIALGSATSGTQILNNIIQDNIAGIGLANSIGGVLAPTTASGQAVIEHNLIQNNNQVGPASGAGIYTDEFVGGSTIGDILIDENAFRGNDDAGIDISNADASGGVFNLDVSTNAFDGNGRAVVFFNTHDSTVHDNSMTNSTLAGSAAIRLFDNNTNLSILRNNLATGVGHAIRLSFLDLVGDPSSGVVIHQNNIGTVGFTSFALDGLLVEPGSTSDTVNAECNWWGSSTGPLALSNPSGTGEEVVGNADFNPWLTAPAPGGPCFGGVPSTPGKVTGGGQVQGDPLFSPFGDLISLPALVPSLAGPQSQATFGFTVRCCAPAGNLEYNDHGANVRIKSQSITGLFISDGACGPNTHATFTGTASVIRPTGTTTQDFQVDVDDCGEPGTMDTFGIKTFGVPPYSSGPSTLVGGNIQIHK